MTITSPYTPASFNGSGTTGPISFTFRILDKTNIKVEKVVGTVVTTLTEGVGAGQYSIVLVAAGLSGGQITLGTALAIGERLIISRVTPRTQLEKLADLRRFNAEIHERALDKATMVIQEAEQIGSSAVKFPTADTPGLNQTLPVDTARASKIMGFNALGEPIVSALNMSQLDNFNTAVTDVQTAATTATNASASAVSAKNAAEAAAAGMKWRPSVRFATIANDTLSGLAARNGITPVAGDRVLVSAQTTASQNGVYIAAAGAWTRATDADTWAELVSQVVVTEEASTISGTPDVPYICTVNAGGTIGVTAITWVVLPSPIADNSITEPKLGTGSVSGRVLEWGAVTINHLNGALIGTAAEIRAGTAQKLVFADALKSAYPNMVVQSVYSETATMTTTTAAIPVDDTIPQITEGVELLTANITPKVSTNRIRVTFEIPWASSGAASNGVIAIFQDAVANALFAKTVQIVNNHDEAILSGTFEFIAGTTSAMVIRARVGISAGTMTINGAAGARLFGGVSKAVLIVQEIQV